MRIFELFSEELKSKGQLVFEKNKPLCAVSSIGVGGEAEVFICPNGVNALCEVLCKAKTRGIPVTVVGNSSNIIYSDSGLRGVVICTKNMRGYRVKNTENGALVFAGGGLMLPELSRICFENGLSGFEGICSVPGTVGGAVMSNAGAYGQCISDDLRGIFILTETGELTFRRTDKSMFSYRSCFAVNKGEIVVGAVFMLRRGDETDIAKRMEYCREMRKKHSRRGLKAWGAFLSVRAFRKTRRTLVLVQGSL